MDEKTWNRILIYVFDYFRIDKLPNDQQIRLWFEQVSYIPNHAVEMIAKEIFKEHDSLPRNLPKAFREHYQMQPFKAVVYDKEEDLRFPVKLMEQGFNILQQKGYIDFGKFTDQVQMPRCDRDRVVTKHKVVNGEIKIDIDRIKNTVCLNINKANQEYITNRVALLQAQKEEILRQPGDEFDDIPF